MPPARLLFYFATAGGIAMSIYSLVRELPPPWIAFTAFHTYLAICILGVIFSRFSMFADVITMGPKDARGVALTFDDGPDPQSTPQILDLLDEADAKATFFVIGRKAEEHPELLAEISERGHAVGVHSYAHARLFSLYPPGRIRRDLQRAIDVLQGITGARPTLFRAPIGHISPSMAKVVRDLELDVVGWSVRGVDGWSGAKPKVVAGKIIRKLDDGAIVMLHDASEKGDFVPASVKALPEILDTAKHKQLPFVLVDQWLGRGTSEEVADAHDEA